MSGWSTGGYGDGTGWGSERASGRQTGVHWGGGSNGGGNGGNNGGSGKTSVSILKIGESHTTKWGTVIINAEGHATMNGIIMTADNSSFVENGPNAITRVLNSLIKDIPTKRGDNVNKDNVGGVFYGLPGHINVADTGRFLGEHGDKPEYYVRSESNIYSVTVLNEKQDLYPRLAYGKHSPNMSARRYTENRAEDLLRAYLNEINDAVKFTADFFKETTAKYGENSAAIARELADSAKGKKLRNATEAMQTYNKYGPAIMKKFSVADRQAIARALESVNRDLVAKNLAKFSKAFGAVGYTIDAAALAKELAKGIRTGDFTSFYVKVETLSAGLIASAIVAFTFAVLTTTPFGILAYGLLLALTGALIDEKLIQKINDKIFN
ncbi:colicin-like pore-forming protein [Serratia quinivorans]|uniref:colicin-like pore-forming protein n=1 Tax=Serratia quinivorans TaxID=137545 RepID=UPI0021784966|nr:colicin-like pore-forming protein [Serratia quinivorans]CAI0858148.1 Colicin-Ia [Serratia quinivorans]CAI2138087.1 Colicin-Ia [Serratia quinivorans]